MASQLWICWQNHTLVKEGLSWSDACEGCTSLFIHDSNPQEWGSPGLQDMWGLVKIECPNLGWFADESKYALPWAWVVLTAVFAIIFIIFYLYYPLTPSKKRNRQRMAPPRAAPPRELWRGAARPAEPAWFNWDINQLDMNRMEYGGLSKRNGI
jgi:hypothetical protein